MTNPASARRIAARSAGVILIIATTALAITTFRQHRTISSLETDLEQAVEERSQLESALDEHASEVERLEEALAGEQRPPSRRAGDAVGRLPNGMSRSEAETLLRDDLQSRGESLIHELTGLEGVLGGTLGFYSREEIQVLNDRWVLAWYEDGHIGGELLLKYTIDEEREVHWTLLDVAEY